MKRTLIQFAALALVAGSLFVGTASAVTIYETVSPSNLNGWGPSDTRPGGASNISPDPASSGDGSWQLTRDASTTSKADFATFWNPASNKFTMTTNVSDLGTWSFDYYRSSLHTSSVQSPAVRMFFTTADNKSGSLVWERAYQGAVGNTPLDSWQTVNVAAGEKLWLRFNNTNYDVAGGFLTLDQWRDPSVAKPTAINFTGAVFTGIQASIGSGVSDPGTTYVDAFAVGFNNGVTSTQVLTNVAVPEPSGVGLALLGGLGAIMRRRRR